MKCELEGSTVMLTLNKQGYLTTLIIFNYSYPIELLYVLSYASLPNMCLISLALLPCLISNLEPSIICLTLILDIIR